MNQVRLIALAVIMLGFLGIVFLVGVFESQNWLLVAFFGLMMLMHLFGHGSHSHDGSHAQDSKPDKEGS